jgi:hypothetical protein
MVLAVYSFVDFIGLDSVILGFLHVTLLEIAVA